MKQKQIALAIILIILVMTLVACSNQTDATPGNTSTYKVTFMVDDAVYKTVKVEEGKSVRMPADPTKEGFSFVGWYSDEGTWESEMTVDLINESVAKGNITVYAKFEDNRKKFQGIVFEDEEFTYDGLPHMIEVSGYPSGTHLEYNMEPPTEVGSYDVEVTLSKSGYITQTYQAVMTICEASFNNVVFESKVYTYDGLEHSIYVEGCPSGTKIEYDVVPTQTEAGVYFITAYLSKNGYEPKSCSATLIIEKAVIDTTKFTFESKEFYQDGQPKSLELVGDLPYGVTVEYINNEQTLDGVYTVTAHFVYDRNNYYEVADMTATLTIITPLTEYDIFYELNGGENSRKNPATYLSPNEEEVVFSAPSRSAWIFDGWYRNEDFEGNPITKLPVNTSGDIYLYAKWVKPYIISTDERFTVDGLSIIGTVENEPEAYSFVESFNACSDCTWKMYYDYQGVNELKLKNLELDCGWNKAYIVVWSEDELAFTQYTLNVYRLSMCSYSFTIDDIVYEEEETILDGIIEEQSYLEAPEAPEKDGYEFVGWKDAEGYFVTFPYYVGEYNIANGANFFAEYKPIDYKITYALNDENSVSKATNPASNPTTYNIEGMAEITDPIREGYTFLGWTYEYDNIEEDYDLTLYAQWEVIEYPIVYSFNDLGSASQAMNATNNPSTYTIEDEITFSNPRRAGYNFVKWDKNGISQGSTGEVTVVASWSIVTYTISYGLSIPESSVSKDVDNSLNATTYTVEDAVYFVSLQRKGYNFSGWSVSYIPSGTTGNKIIYASWKAIKYHINYNFGDSNSASKAVNNELNPATYTIEDEVSLSAPTRAGYDFVKWDNDKIAKGSTGEVSFNASWHIISYDITYDFAIPADSASQTASNNRENPSKYTVEDTITFNPASRSGYTFVAWDILSIPAGTYGAVTIKASWEIVEYPITYNFGDSDSVSKAINADGNPVVYTIEDGATYADPTREGYTFVGWDIPTIAKGTFGAKTITARWEAIRYAITYDMGDADSSFKAVNNAQNPATYTIEDEVTLSAPTRDGCTFVQWDNPTISRGSTGAKTVVASWNYITYTITYVIDGGTNHQDNPATFTVADLPLVLKEADFGDDVFNSWRSTNSLSGDKMDVITTSGNKTVYALSGGTEGLTYTLSSDGTNYSVSGYTGTLTDVVIGKKYNGKPVLGISSNAFKGKSITSIRISDSVTTIGSHAFYNCTSLTSITIPDSVTSISKSTFCNCSNLATVTFAEGSQLETIGLYAFYGCTGLTSIVIPASVTTIGERAFEGCTSLTSIVIPDSVTTIGGCAFYGCTSLTSVTIGNSVTSIGDSAFNGCTSLTSVTIGDSVTTIRSWAFDDCTGLKDVYYTGDIAGWCGISFGSSDANPMYYADNLYIDGKLVEDLVIPDSVTSIGGSAFYGCTSLTSVTIGDSVTTIGGYAFYGCTSLTSVTIGDSVTTIRSLAFRFCSCLKDVYYTGDIAGWCGISFGDGEANPMYCADNLYIDGKLVEGELVIPDSVTTIGEYAFLNCSKLRNIAIPDSVITIGDSAFAGCTRLTSVTIGGSVNSIGKKAFYACSSLTSVTMGDSVTTIGSDAFGYCSGLKDVYYTGDIAGWCGISFGSADANPMYYADNLYIAGELLTEAVIPNTVTKINTYAFYNCSSLTRVTIPDSVTTIGNDAFKDCSELTNVYYLGTLEQWCGMTFGNAYANPMYYADNLYIAGELIEGELAIPDSVTTIGDRTFFNCTGLTSITIPDSVTTIGGYAFYNCTGLKDVYYTGDIAGWCGISFGSANANPMYHADNLYIDGKLVEGELVIPDSVTSIGNFAFVNCSSLTSIVIPDSVTSIGEEAFYNCDSLTNIVIPDSVTAIGKYAFWYSDSLISVTIGDSVAAIGESAFYGCYKLVEVYNKSSLNIVAGNSGYGYVGYYALNVYTEEGGSKLSTDEDGFIIYTNGADKILVKYVGKQTDLIIPDGIKEIYKWAFFNCDSLTSVVIPDSVTTIGEYAFRDCTSLTSIVIPDSVTTIGRSAFLGCSSLESLTIPFVGAKAGVTGSSTNQYPLGYLFGTSSYTGGVATTQYYYGSSTSSTTSTTYYIPSSLKSVTVTGGYIPTGAFYNCNNITNITLGDDVTTIGSYAFNDCTSLTSITIPDSVTTIGSYAFWDCDNLTSVTIGDSVTTIGSGAFYYCDSLTSVTIGDSVATIGENAFYGCYKLVEVYNKSSLNIVAGNSGYGYVGYYALNVYTEEGGSKLSTDEDGFIIYTNGADKILVKYVGKQTDLIIPDGIKEIYKWAFNSCDSLTSVVIPDSVTTIGSYAFNSCDSLTSVVIPDSVTTIGSYAFNSCDSLTSVTFGENSQLTTIGSDAFGYCSCLKDVYYTGDIAGWCGISFGSSDANPMYYADNLYIDGKLVEGELVIPDSVTGIGSYAFYNCTSLTDVYYTGDIAGWCGITFGNVYANPMYYADNLYIDGKLVEGELIIPDGVTSIPAYAFRGQAITRVTIPDSVTSIGDCAFRGCSSLESLTIPFVGAKAGVTSSDTYQYPLGYLFGTSSYTGGVATTQYYYGSSTSSTTSTTYYIPSSLKSVTVTGGYIPTGAFYNCNNITNITLGDDVTTIGDYAFSGCNSLTSISVDENNPKYKSIDGNLYSKAGKILIKYAIGKTATSFVIPDSVTTIGDMAFYGCTELTSAIIPNSVTTIGYRAFYSCTSLTSVTFGENSQLTTIGDYAFAGCDSLTSIVIPDSVTTIGSYAFNSCDSLTSVTFGENSQLTTIGSYAFSGCYRLVEVYNKSSLNIVAGNSDYGYVGYYALNVYTEEGGSKLSTDEDGFIIYTDGADKILVGYKGNDTEFTIPEDITEINKYAFYYCTSLTSIVIPDSVTTIGSYAFSGCTSLTNIVIPDSVTTIYTRAFNGCTGLTSIYYTGTEAQWNNISIGSNNSPLTNATRVYNYDGVERTYSFVTNCDQSIDPVTAKYLSSLPTLTRDGYHFCGWYDNEAFEGKAVSEPYCSKDKTTLYAKWLTEEEWLALPYNGTSFAKAFIAESGQTYDVNITTGGQIVYFAFTPTTSGSFTIQSTGSGDTYGTLYSSTKSSLTTNDDGGSGSNFKITYTMTAATTYYVAVKFYNSSTTGTFKVSFS